jgi:hypothetical protein
VGLGPRVIDQAVVSCGGDEGVRYRMRWFALQARAAVHLFRSRRPAHQPYDLWTRAPMPETGPPRRQVCVKRVFL